MTGIGLITGFGAGREVNATAAIEGRSGIRAIASIDASALDCRIAGEVPTSAIPPDIPKFDRFTRLALVAAEEAAVQARLDDPAIDRERIATLIGTGLGGCETLDSTYMRLYGKGQTRTPPTAIPHTMYNAATSAVSSRFKARGPAYAVVSACSSGAHAIGHAADWIRAGRADVAVCGGSDAPITFGVIRGWESLRVLSIRNDDPESACRPFSADRAGLVLAEGSAVLILESFENAIRRGQPILGEVAGSGATSDAGHLTDPSTDGAAQAMRLALADAGIESGRIEYVNAHGTATRANDSAETAAIKAVFGETAPRLAVSSTKSMHGHAMGASGAIEIALSLLVLNEGFIPPTANLHHPDPECDLDYVPLYSRQRLVDCFLSNSFGFGGLNGVVVLRTKHNL